MCLSIYLPIYLSIYPSNSLSYSIVIFLLTLRIRCAPYLFGIYVHTEPWHQSTILQELCDQVKAILCDRVVDGHVSLLIRAVGVRFTWRKRSKVFNFQEKKGEPLDIMTDREFGWYVSIMPYFSICFYIFHMFPTFSDCKPPIPP